MRARNDGARGFSDGVLAASTLDLNLETYGFAELGRLLAQAVSV